jgi:Protein of unknown function (DUF2510)
VSLGLGLERQRYAPGETVRGFVDVREDIDARSLAVTLRYAEETHDYSGAVYRPASQTLHEGPLGTGSRFDFSLTLPADALPAFQTQRSAVWWEVIASVDKRGFDKHVRLRIDVVPHDLGGVLFPANAVHMSVFQQRAPALPPPGWHPDPWGQAAQRYWDGAAWTHHTA